MRVLLVFISIALVVNTGCSRPLTSLEAKNAFEKTYKRATREECIPTGLQVLPIVCSFSTGFKDTVVSEILVAFGYEELHHIPWNEDAGPPILSKTFFQTSVLGLDANVNIVYNDEQLYSATINTQSGSKLQVRDAYKKLLEYITCSFDVTGEVEDKNYFVVHFYCAPGISIFLDDAGISLQILYNQALIPSRSNNLETPDEIRRRLRVWEEMQKVTQE